MNLNSKTEITSVDIPFLQLVWLMSKIIVACVPAVAVAAFIVATWLLGFSVVIIFIGELLR